MKEFKINNRIWIEKKGKPFLGDGRITLLESIDREGSINKASKLLGMSYKRAWQLINAINELADEPLVVRTTGGPGGGGTAGGPGRADSRIGFLNLGVFGGLARY